MKTLKLTIKKKWFDLIAKGIKTEEYREVKPYWNRRLASEISNRTYHFVEFRNGYRKDSPTITLELKNITFGMGKSEWGADPDNLYYVLHLGKEISRENVK